MRQQTKRGKGKENLKDGLGSTSKNGLRPHLFASTAMWSSSASELRSPLQHEESTPDGKEQKLLNLSSEDQL